jgi:hypothetical protein
VRGKRKREIGNWKREIGKGKLEKGNWKREKGKGKREKGKGKREKGNTQNAPSVEEYEEPYEELGLIHCKLLPAGHIKNNNKIIK